MNQSHVLVRRALFGAIPNRRGTAFKVWAPAARDVSLVLESGRAAGEHRATARADGIFVAEIEGARPGDLYRYRLDGGRPLPDPSSRFQPQGVHGPSEIVDPAAFAWRDAAWDGIPADAVIIYELHVGTFTRQGTFDAVTGRLPYLRDLGVTAVELMPVAAFPGGRNWGYDGVDLFAPSPAYGRPDDLRRLVDAAHRQGIAVFLDVVYNHLGPDGAYMSTFAPQFFTSRHHTAWGDAVNLDDEDSRYVREFLIDNALHWVLEYHCDGLRLDAAHALVDESPSPFLAEVTRAVHEASRGRALVIAEDHRNLAGMLREPREGGWGLDGVWADDFHHIVRRIVAGDAEGYYEDYRASAADLARTLRAGWLFTGQYSRHLHRHRGTDPSGIPRRKFIICVQNHDQIGNRAFGDRIVDAVHDAAYRAASALLLLAPETPLLFMGQEWGASTPFLYFTDHAPELAEKVVEGRRREFEGFAGFGDSAGPEQIPSPQAARTFDASRVNWDERLAAPHAGALRLYKRLIELRNAAIAIDPAMRDRATVEAPDDDTVLIKYDSQGSHYWIVVRLRGSGTVALDELPADARVMFTTEDDAFAIDGRPPSLRQGSISFPGPAGALIAFNR